MSMPQSFDRRNVAAHRRDFKSIGEIRKNAREVVRVDCNMWRNRPLVSIRVWYKSEGQWLPGRDGLTVAPESVADLIELLGQARDESRRRGWLDDEITGR